MDIVLSHSRPLEESPLAMEEAIKLLLTKPAVSSIVVKYGDKILDYRDDLPLLKKIASAVKGVEEAYKDPVGFYLSLRRKYIDIKLEGKEDKHILKLLKRMEEVFSPYEDVLAGRRVGDRTVYYYLFSPYISFPYSGIKLKINPPNLPLIEKKKLEDGSYVNIYDGYYFLLPPEVNRDISKDVEMFKKEVSEDYIGERMVLIELARKKNLPEFVVRNSFGFGVLEALFYDKDVEDVYINGYGERVVVRHTTYGELTTNLFVSKEEIDRWERYLRFVVGKPFDEFSPVMDGMLPVEKKVRFSAVKYPLSKSTAFAFRKHRDEVFSLPFLIKTGFITEADAALLWMVVHGGRSMLIAGPRGGGKTTLLSSLMFEMPRRHRIVVIEDTEELPVEKAKELGYNVLHLTFKQPIGQSYGLDAADVLRASLRLGDSSLFLGEVRGKEAKVLYEAMRVAGLSSFVGGTIHGESAYGVYDRVVNDLSVPKSSFKATDVIVLISKFYDISHRKMKRVVSQSYYLEKEWEDYPIFTPLSKSSIIEEIAKSHFLSKDEFLEVLKSRELFYKHLITKGKLSVGEVVRSNEVFLDVFSKADIFDSSLIYEKIKSRLYI